MSQAAAAESHPVASCPGARAHLRALDRAERLARDLERLQRRVRGRLESLARQFDRVLRVLEAWAYVDGWTLTENGNRLARLYHESDLLIAECLSQGLLDGLGRTRGGRADVGVHLRGPGPGRDDRHGSRTPGCAGAGRTSNG